MKQTKNRFLRLFLCSIYYILHLKVVQISLLLSFVGYQSELWEMLSQSMTNYSQTDVIQSETSRFYWWMVHSFDLWIALVLCWNEQGRIMDAGTLSLHVCPTQLQNLQIDLKCISWESKCLILLNVILLRSHILKYRRYILIHQIAQK